MERRHETFERQGRRCDGRGRRDRTGLRDALAEESASVAILNVQEKEGKVLADELAAMTSVAGSCVTTSRAKTMARTPFQTWCKKSGRLDILVNSASVAAQQQDAFLAGCRDQAEIPATDPDAKLAPSTNEAPSQQSPTRRLDGSGNGREQATEAAPTA
ncbi:MAG: hypothetical protein ABI740_00785 [Alphaproteobacteria bacterium]